MSFLRISVDVLTTEEGHRVTYSQLFFWRVWGRKRWAVRWWWLHHLCEYSTETVLLGTICCIISWKCWSFEFTIHSIHHCDKPLKKLQLVFTSLTPMSLSLSSQCQWAHVGASLHPRTTAPFRIPDGAFWSVLVANLLYAATPVLVALRVHSNPYFFLKISPFPGQTGLPNSEEKDTKYKDKW